MRQTIGIVSTAVTLTVAMMTLSVPASAAEDGRTKQQELMASCNKAAGQKEIKGDDRKKFMSSCLKGEVPVASSADKRTPQQEKMTSCNKEAGSKELKGDERKKFMSTCLKG
jgi:hypothetical protein